MKRWFVQLTLVALLGVISCVAAFLISTRMGSPSSRKPLASGQELPVLVLRGEAAEVVMVKPGEIPPLPPGATYLVPPGNAKAIQASLNARLADTREGGWGLQVDDKGNGRQLIELYWVSDNYDDGTGYEATATGITLRYRKLYGPGHAIGAGSVWVGLTWLLWVSSSAAVLWATHPRRRLTNP